MQDFEVERYEAAKQAFEEAFERGYARGLGELDKGAPKDFEASLPIEIRVRRDDIVDGEWHAYTPHFEDVGYKVAHSQRRRGRARLDAGVSSPDLRESGIDNTCRWFAIDPD